MIESCKKCRREGEKLLLKGERCLSQKCALVKRNYAPGQTGQSFRGKQSEYGKQLREKQKAKRYYIVGEKQFSNYAEKAERMLGNSSENLLQLLETRLDNVVYRLGLTNSRNHSRQLISHGFIRVNGEKVSIPSFQVKVGDIIEPKKKENFTDIRSTTPSWIDFDVKNLSAKINHTPMREEIDTTVNESLIIEFYSR